MLRNYFNNKFPDLKPLSGTAETNLERARGELIRVLGFRGNVTDTKVKGSKVILKFEINPLKYLCPGRTNLYIDTPYIGPGLFIQHGWSTGIAAKSIGSNCWINEQVLIGFSEANERATIEDNVIVYAGAKVFGGITIGSNSKIGANAVVVKDVPKNCTVVGVPAYIVKRDGLPTRERL